MILNHDVKQNWNAKFRTTARPMLCKLISTNVSQSPVQIQAISQA